MPGKSPQKTARIPVDVPDLSGIQDFKTAIRQSVYRSGKPAKEIALELGYSESQFSRKLSFNEADPNYFPAHRLPELMAATGSLLPLYWLVAQCFGEQHAIEQSELEKTQRAMAEVAVALIERFDRQDKEKKR